MKKIFIVLTFIFISLLSFADNTNVGVRIPLGEQKVELDNNLKFLLGLTKVENSTKYKKFINYVEENLAKKGIVKYSGAINLKKGFKIFGSHTDSPGFRIKPNPEMVTENILRLNTEVYGGPILSTWFDRPLSIAGRVGVPPATLILLMN